MRAAARRSASPLPVSVNVAISDAASCSNDVWCRRQSSKLGTDTALRATPRASLLSHRRANPSAFR